MITTRVVDTVFGGPAMRVPVELDVFITGQGWKEVGHGLTSDRGEIDEFHEPTAAGVYRLNYDIASHSPDSLYPSIAVMLEVKDPTDVYRVELVLSGNGYTVFRG